MAQNQKESKNSFFSQKSKLSGTIPTKEETVREAIDATGRKFPDTIYEHLIFPYADYPETVIDRLNEVINSLPKSHLQDTLTFIRNRAGSFYSILLLKEPSRRDPEQGQCFIELTAGESIMRLHIRELNGKVHREEISKQAFEAILKSLNLNQSMSPRELLVNGKIFQFLIKKGDIRIQNIPPIMHLLRGFIAELRKNFVQEKTTAQKLKFCMLILGILSLLTTLGAMMNGLIKNDPLAFYNNSASHIEIGVILGCIILGASCMLPFWKKCPLPSFLQNSKQKAISKTIEILEGEIRKAIPPPSGQELLEENAMLAEWRKQWSDQQHAEGAAEAKQNENIDEQQPGIWGM